MKKAIIAFIICIGLSLLMVSCKTNSRDVAFQAYYIGGRTPDHTKYIIWADSSFKVGDTVNSGFNNDQCLLIQRIK